jgi:far upstream element-binding protein
VPVQHHPYGRGAAAPAPGGPGYGAPAQPQAAAPQQTAADLANLLRQVNEAMAGGPGGAVAPGPPVGVRGGGAANATRVISGADPRAARRARASAGPPGPPAQQQFGAPRVSVPPPPPVAMAPPPPQQFGAPPRFGGGAHAAQPGAYGVPAGPPGAYGGGPPGPPGAPGFDPSAVTEYVMCPPEKAGKVIGHGGDKINSIQAESGASVKIQNQSDVGPGQPRRITVTGAPDRVAHAVRIVNELIAPPPQRAPVTSSASGARDPNAVEIFIPVDPDCFGKIIGRGGDTIRRLQEESGVRMQVDRTNSRVQITGDASGCEVARTLLQEVLDEANQPAPSGIKTTEIPAQGQEGRIIGKGGENIRNMSAQTGAKITIIKETGMVKIVGPPECVESAIQTVNDFIETQLNPVSYQGGGGAGAGIPSDTAGAAAYDPAPTGGLTPYKPLWETHTSPEGYTYFYNTSTGSTQWDEPEDYDGFS